MCHVSITQSVHGPNRGQVWVSLDNYHIKTMFETHMDEPINVVSSAYVYDNQQLFQDLFYLLPTT